MQTEMCVLFQRKRDDIQSKSLCFRKATYSSEGIFRVVKFFISGKCCNFLSRTQLQHEETRPLSEGEYTLQNHLVGEIFPPYKIPLTGLSTDSLMWNEQKEQSLC